MMSTKTHNAVSRWLGQLFPEHAGHEVTVASNAPKRKGQFYCSCGDTLFVLSSLARKFDGELCADGKHIVGAVVEA